MKQAAPECTVDADCPSKLACINEKCSNPCKEQKVCSADQICSVLDTLPLRTMICKCPPETVSDERGNCKAILREQPACTNDFDCPRDVDVCRNGNCIPACRDKECGLNAQCHAQNHQARCTCPEQYIGNPLVQCTYETSMPRVPECYQDDDCPYDRTCQNTKCINPCKDLNQCGRDAICHVESKEIFFKMFFF